MKVKILILKETIRLVALYIIMTRYKKKDEGNITSFDECYLFMY